MAIQRTVVGTPIELPVSMLGSDLSTYLYDVRQYDKIKPQGLYTNIIDFFSKGMIDYGKGYSITFATALQDVKPYDKTTSPYTLAEPKMGTETQFLEFYEVATVSINQLFPKETFNSGYGINQFLSNIESLNAKSMIVDMFENKLEPKFRTAGNWKNQSVIPFNQTAQTEPNQILAQKVLNATNICEWIANRAVQYQRYQNDLTDVAGIGTQLSLEDLVLVIDTTLSNYIKAAMGLVYTPEKILELFKCGFMVEIPAEKGSTGLVADGKTGVAWILDKDKFSVILGYNTSLSNTNGSNGYTNIFNHRACAVDLFTMLAGEFIALGGVTP